MTVSLIRFAGFEAALLGLSLATDLRAATSTDPSGVWLVADGRARIRIELCGPLEKNACGYVVWLKSPLTDEGQPRTDFKNPDPKKRARLSLGHQMIMGLKPNPDGHYDGKVYNSEEGKVVDVSIWTETPGELTIHGCMLGIFCGSQTWDRVTDVVAGQLAGPTNGPNGPRADPEWAPKPGHPPAH